MEKSQQRETMLDGLMTFGKLETTVKDRRAKPLTPAGRKVDSRREAKSYCQRSLCGYQNELELLCRGIPIHFMLCQDSVQP